MRMGLAQGAVLIVLLGAAYADAQEIRQTLPAIRQVWLDVLDAPAVLGTGSWSIIPKSQFARTLELAEKVALAERRMPWLLQAQYEARIEGLQLTGSAELLIHNPHDIAAWTQLNPWTMPLRSDQVSTSPSSIRSLSERSLALLAEPRGNSSYKLNWSVQGEERSDGKWFLFQLPNCAQATMNVVVPLPHRLDWPSARQHLRGPFPIEGSNARRWQLQLGGDARQDVQLLVRTPFEQRQVSWMEARLDADFIINGQEVQARYEIDVQRWHDRLRTLTFDLPEQLIVKSLSLRQLGTDVPLAHQRSTPTTMTIALPESVEQRVTLVVEAEWSVRRGERIVFHQPGLRGVASIKPTLRVVSMPSEPLVDWNWGDYVPQQMSPRDRPRESVAEILTLSPRLNMGSTTLAPPSARLVEQKVDLTYQQDTWWHLGKRTQQLTVRCQCTASQKQSEFLSWQVPSGWAVKEVSSDPLSPIQAWTWHAGQPLEIQWGTVSRMGLKATVTVVLVPGSPVIVTEEPRAWFMPNLVPLLAGRFAGSYAITLERAGELLPPSLVVIKSPGTRTSPPLTPLELWSSAVSVPDLYWRLQDAGTTGSVQLQDWPATVRASLQTEIVDTEKASQLKYRMKLQPLAGTVTRWPVSFSGAVPDVAWKSITMKDEGAWRLESPIAGLFSWPEPLDRMVELEAMEPWTAGRAVPLLMSPLPFEGRLKLGRFWKLPTTWKGEPEWVKQSDDESIWHYDGKTEALELKRQVTERLELITPVIVTHLDGQMAESEYSVTVPPHADPVTLSMADGAEVISCEVDDKPGASRQNLELAPSNRPVSLRLKYRSSIKGGRLLSIWKPQQPYWNVKAVPEPEHVLIQHQQSLPAYGLVPGQQQGALGTGYISDGKQMTVWINLKAILVSVLITAIAFALLALRRSWLRFLVILFALLVFIAGFLSLKGLHYGWFLPAVAVIAAAWSLLRHRFPWRRQVTVATVGLIILMGAVIDVEAQTERTSLVYILRGDTEKKDDERVMVPASLWLQLQMMAKQVTGGGSQRWWISQAATEGQLLDNRLRLTSKWILMVNGDEPVEIPWQETRPPEEVTLDGQSVQPRLIGGPFGLQQWAIGVRRPGTHELVLKWELPVKQDGAMQSVEMKCPGAPYQQLTIKGVPEKVQVQGTPGTWQVKQQEGTQTLLADSGLSRAVTLTWSMPQAKPPEVVVNEAVLWEHRVHQSVAHAVLAYHIEQGMLDQFTVELPAGLRLRSISVVGEVQTAVTPRIKQWRIEQVDGKQHLLVYLQRPVTGTVHLLLEMPWQRDARSDTVPLESLKPVGARVRHSIIAWLADGLLAEPLAPVAAARSEEVEFARPWLPSLGSLPASAITRADRGDERVVLLRLQPWPSQPTVKTESSIVMDSQGVQYRFAVETKSQQGPLVYLNGLVSPGLVISEVVGTQVARWYQTPAAPGEPSQLSLWFASGFGQSQEASCTLIARQPVEMNEGQHLRLPVYQIKWDGIVREQTQLKLFSTRPGKITSVLANAAIRSIPGPWMENDVIAAFELPASLPGGVSLTMQEENPQLVPKAAAAWDNTQSEPRWVLTITAPAGGMLPAQMEMLALDGQLEQNWIFDAAAPLAFRPNRSTGSAIAWSVQLSKPVNKLQVKCYPLRDAHGKPVPPLVSFPAWSGMVIVPAK